MAESRAASRLAGGAWSAHLALCGLRRGSGLHGGSVPPVLQQLLLQFILFLRGVEVVHGHELVAELLQPAGGGGQRLLGAWQALPLLPAL